MPASAPPTAEEIRVGHIVGAVADIGHGQTCEASLVFEDGLQVGKDLARVVVVGEGVDDGDARVPGHLLQTVLAERAPDDRARLRSEHTSDISDRFALADLGKGGVHNQRMTAQARNGAHERHLGAQGRLVEEDGDDLRALERTLTEGCGL